MLEEPVQAREVDKAEEVLDAESPSRDKPPEVVHPGEEPFHFPAPPVTSQLAPRPGFCFYANSWARSQATKSLSSVQAAAH
jgi:hypothetical protein